MAGGPQATPIQLRFDIPPGDPNLWTEEEGRQFNDVLAHNMEFACRKSPTFRMIAHDERDRFESSLRNLNVAINAYRHELVQVCRVTLHDNGIFNSYAMNPPKTRSICNSCTITSNTD